MGAGRSHRRGVSGRVVAGQPWACACAGAGQATGRPWAGEGPGGWARVLGGRWLWEVGVENVVLGDEGG